MENKNKLRKDILKMRLSLTYEKVAEKSKVIIKKLINSDEYKKSKTVFIYIDFKNEVRTYQLIESMLVEGKNVIIPYTDTVNTKLIPVKLNNIEKDLKISSFGYLEPKEEIVFPIELNEIDLIIVPGVVFDKNLNRIGFGKGYYDRILNHTRSDARAVALAYEFQVLSEIPCEKHDIKMDMIITEKSIYD